MWVERDKLDIDRFDITCPIISNPTYQSKLSAKMPVIR